MRTRVVIYIGAAVLLTLGIIYILMSRNAYEYKFIPEQELENPFEIKRTLNFTKQSMYTCPDQSDCWKLQKMLKANWDSKKPKAAVYILSRASDAKDLKKTLKDLETNFLLKYTYPVIIFHEQNFIPLIPEIRHLTNLNTFFQEVQFQVPQNLYPSAKAYECEKSGMGYQHMCRFHAKLVYEIPIMRNLEYYLRLDAHSYIWKPVPYDLFKYMKDSNILYLYPCLQKEVVECSRNLRDAVDTYIKVRHIKPHFLNTIYGSSELRMFYNNFEMARMDVFKGVAYQNYINYIDQLGGIYYHRWGDAPIKSLALSIFVRENQTRHIYDVAYSHRDRIQTYGLSSKPKSDHCSNN